MVKKNALKNYKINGFVVLKKIFSKKEISKILLELEIIKNLLKTKKIKSFIIRLKMEKLIQFTMFKNFIKIIK